MTATLSVALSAASSFPSFGAAITEMTQGPIRVTKGDVVILEAQPSESANHIEWWSEGQIICQKIRCDIDTSTFTPGEYRYEVVVSDDEGLAVATVAISAEDAKPLHVPRVVMPATKRPTEGYAEMNLGDWVIVPRAGLITGIKDSAGNKPIGLTTPSKMTDGFTYSVASGSQAIIRQVGSPRQWLLSAPSSFRMKGSLFQLISGKAIFRQTESEDPSNQIARAYLAAVEVRTTGAALIGVEIDPVKANGRKMIVKNFAGSEVSLICNPADIASVNHALARHMALSAEGSCVGQADVLEPSGDPGVWLSAWMPWWTSQGATLGADRWRAERILWQQMLSETALTKKVSDALKQHTCPDVLDLLTAGGVRSSESESSNQAMGDCLFDLGMIRAALQNFKHMESKSHSPAWTAFMLGNCYQSLGQPVLALSWYELAERRGFADLDVLGRSAAEAALKADRSQARLRWLETAAIFGENQQFQQSNWNAVQDWRTNRRRGGTIGGKFYMDGQALPINSKKTTGMPQSATSSRSTVYAIDGTWWAHMPVSKDGVFKISGLHNFVKPYPPSMAIGQTSIHEVTTSFEAGQSENSGWSAEVGLHLGTGISGSERQRDHFGWSAILSRPDWLGLSFGIDSSKYLDPNPGGSDLLDLDLNRFTGEGDHSHIDLMGLVGWQWGSNANLKPRLNLNIGYGRVDYRTGDLDQYDHTLTQLEIDARWPISDQTVVTLGPRHLTRRFKDQGGTETDAKITAGIHFRTAPLWTTSIQGSYESRQTSADESLTYVGHSYGFGLSVDL